ncbi:hypothetical protein BOTBODRAFT_79894, partial [Botryobasidium botryosum FD-172 SS1]
TTFRIALPNELKQRGTHDTFHASLLRVHVPNDDRRFPGRQIEQITGFGDLPNEWAVDRIVSHYGTGSQAIFQVKWKTGDHS